MGRVLRNYSTLDKKLQDSYQETIGLLPGDYSKMIEYFNFFLQCTLVALLGTTVYYIYSLLKIAEASLNALILEVPYDPLESDIKPQKLVECVLTGNSKQYLGETYTDKQVNKLTAEEVDKLLTIMKQNFQAKW